MKDGYLPAGAFIGAIFVIIAILGSLSNIIRNPAGALFDDISVKLFGLLGMFFLSVVMNFFVKTNTKIFYFYYPQFLAKDAEKLLAKCEPLGLVIDFDIKHITKLIEETKLKKQN